VVDGAEALGWTSMVVREFQLKVFLAQTSRLVNKLEFADLLVQVPNLALVLVLHGA
jgi:hypothetical protein